MKQKINDNKSAYARAGVNIDEKMASIGRIKKLISATKTKAAISEVGSFGGFFKTPAKNSILVASTDGVGTKLKVAVMAGKHDTVGEDLVNHCVNDILVHGATPLFFLDYFGASRFDSKIFEEVVTGLCRGCKNNGCTLIGGETAELPGLYPEGEYDLVGTIVGCVSKEDLITGKNVKAGDIVLGLTSSGLHTNGYSLARKIIFEKLKMKLSDRVPDTKISIQDALLAVHKSYLKAVVRLRKSVQIKAMAHITGGGFQDNIPRVLPKNVSIIIDRSLWRVPPLFSFLQEYGGVSRDEMYRVFNMGVGLVVVVNENDVEKSLKQLKMAGEKAFVVGWVEKGSGNVKLIK
jgi:phosphoribosylformylglycinamidine cyclo-ligase